MQKHPLSVLSSFPAFSRLAVDLTLYRRPVFDTLTKVSSAQQGQVSEHRQYFLLGYLQPKSVLWRLKTWDKG